MKKVLIPSSLRLVKDSDGLQDWMIHWRPTTGATMLEEIRANNALRTERFVRWNISAKAFEAWRIENPRGFQTEREVAFIQARDTAATKTA